MRLIETTSLELVEFADDADIPEYAILSHTWEDEVSFQDVQMLKQADLGFVPKEVVSRIKDRSGFIKMQRAAQEALRNGGFKYLWIDTCCINKESSAELSEAINSMFRWYKKAEICYAYLSDVKPTSEEDPAASDSSFRRSRWFTRGWTLQELIAPAEIIFFSSDWSIIDRKSSPQMCALLGGVTGVDERVLAGVLSPTAVSVARRMRWAAHRLTTRREDVAYCLMGLFDVNMPLLYGEGGKRAFLRLQEEIMKETDDQSLLAWSSWAPRDNTEQLCGLLADSPADFADAGNIRALPPLQTVDSVPSTITNQGLRLHLYIQPALDAFPGGFSKDDYLAFLDCTVLERGEYLCPTLVLRKLWGDQFARVRRIPLLHRKDPRTDNQSSLRQGYQRLYVKQHPRQLLPAVTVRAGGYQLLENRGAAHVYSVQEVFPPDRWDAASLVLTSELGPWDHSLAILRFADDDGNPRLDVGVGLRKVDGLWRPWCRQSHRVRQRLVAAYDDFQLAIMQADLDGQEQTELSGSATIQEITRHGRPFFQLEVVEKPEIGGEEIAVPQRSPDIANPAEETSTGTGPLAGPQRSTEDAIHRLLASCCIADSVDVSIFPPGTLTKKIRVRGPNNSHRKTPWEFFELVISAITDAIPEPDKPWPRTLTRPDGGLNSHLSCLSTAQLSVVRSKVLEEFHHFSPLHLTAVDGNEGLARRWYAEPSSLGPESAFPVADEGLAITHVVAILSRPLHVDSLRSLIRTHFKALGQGEAAIESVFDALCARTTRTMESPLHFAAAYAAEDGVGPLFDLLLNPADEQMAMYMQAQNSLRVRNYLDETPLHRACAMGNIAAVRRIIRSGPDSVAELDGMGRSTVWHAAAGGHADIIPLVVANGGLLDLADDEGRTPLHAASREGHSDAVRVLLLLGANPAAETNFLRLTPGHLAALFGHTSCIQQLSFHSPGFPSASPADAARCMPIHLAAANGHWDCVSFLLQASADISSGCNQYVVVEDVRHDGDGSMSLVEQDTVLPRSRPDELAAAWGHHDIADLIRSELNRRQVGEGPEGTWTTRPRDGEWTPERQPSDPFVSPLESDR